MVLKSIPHPEAMTMKRIIRNFVSLPEKPVLTFPEKSILEG